MEVIDLGKGLEDHMEVIDLGKGLEDHGLRPQTDEEHLAALSDYKRWPMQKPIPRLPMKNPQMRDKRGFPAFGVCFVADPDVGVCFVQKMYHTITYGDVRSAQPADLQKLHAEGWRGD